MKLLLHFGFCPDLHFPALHLQFTVCCLHFPSPGLPYIISHWHVCVSVERSFPRGSGPLRCSSLLARRPQEWLWDRHMGKAWDGWRSLKAQAATDLLHTGVVVLERLVWWLNPLSPVVNQMFRDQLVPHVLWSALCPAFPRTVSCLAESSASWPSWGHTGPFSGRQVTPSRSQPRILKTALLTKYLNLLTKPKLSQINQMGKKRKPLKKSEFSFPIFLNSKWLHRF